MRYLITFFLVVACTSLAYAKDLKATLDISEEFTLKKTPFKQGEQKASLELDGNLFSSDLMVIKFGDQQVTLTVPSEMFAQAKKGEAFAIPLEGEKISIQGTSNTKVLEKRNWNWMERCTYCGYCHFTNTQGIMEYGHSLNCEGHRTVKYESAKVRSSMTLQFLSKGKVIGTLKTEPTIKEDTKEVEELLPCR